MFAVACGYKRAWIELPRAAARLFVISEMDEDGVVFGDGIETDRLEFGYGRRVEVHAVTQTLNLLMA